MSRIQGVFDKLKENNEKALIGYLTFGSPSNDVTVELALEMEKRGLDILEIGIPYSDPVADGETIRIAGERALANGTKVKDVMEGVFKIRSQSEMPIVILTYINTVFKYGVDKFFKDLKEKGGDGVIIPDLPLEERDEVYDACKESGIDLIPLVTKVSKDRIEAIVDGVSGFVYCVSLLGVTGTRSEIEGDLTDYMDSVKDCTDIPRAIGFGISSGDMAKKFKDITEGIIVGSAFVKETLEDVSVDVMKQRIGDKVEEIKTAIK